MDYILKDDKNNCHFKAIFFFLNQASPMHGAATQKTDVLEKEEEKAEMDIEKLFRKSPNKKRGLEELNLFF